jgi:lysophospholipid acyltransferase (LPLAT)-like uncharacterized protein
MTQPPSGADTDLQALIPLDRVSRPIWLMTSMFGRTWRYRMTGSGTTTPLSPRDDAPIFCFWHENLLTGFHRFQHCNLTALISSSRDGQRLSAVLQRWGYDLIRGSSSKKGYSSLRQCIRVLQEGKSIVITPDGPRGPRRTLKPGITAIAAAAGARVAPMALHASWYIRLKSWDRFVVPLPFSRIDITIGQPVDPTAFASTDEGRHAFGRAITDGLNA